MTRALVLAIVSLFALPLAAADATTVILVRHAEKDSAASPADPPLTESGKQRAAELARILRDTKIDAVYVTPYARTRDTAAPVAAALGLRAVELQPGKTMAAETAELIRTKHAGQTVLVVGHSNSTPDLARALGAADVPAIADPWEFDNLFVVTFRGDEVPHFVRMRYGATSVAP
jgi:broad specificity phosphatase PhoE